MAEGTTPLRRKRRLKAGDLADLQRVLWRTIVEVEALLDVRPPCTDLLLKAAHALGQIGGVYLRLLEGGELTALQVRVAALEALIQEQRSTNGHQVLQR